jgi:hypothetical protein
MSALPPKADIRCAPWDVHFVPKAAVSDRSNQRSHAGLRRAASSAGTFFIQFGPSFRAERPLLFPAAIGNEHPKPRGRRHDQLPRESGKAEQ